LNNFLDDLSKIKGTERKNSALMCLEIVTENVIFYSINTTQKNYFAIAIVDDVTATKHPSIHSRSCFTVTIIRFNG
jgi:hypothetical protein